MVVGVLKIEWKINNVDGNKNIFLFNIFYIYFFLSTFKYFFKFYIRMWNTFTSASFYPTLPNWVSFLFVFFLCFSLVSFFFFFILVMINLYVNYVHLYFFFQIFYYFSLSAAQQKINEEHDGKFGEWKRKKGRKKHERRRWL
jgi:hypothetical protein